MASFPCTATSVRQARTYVKGALAGHPSELVDSASMLVSELATNALLHATTAFEVTVSPGPHGAVRVEVRDVGGGEPRPQRPPPTAEHGRGLQLVAALSDRWGVEAGGVKEGKTVWFELDPLPESRHALPG